jgi:hypothetical protein
MVTWAPERDLDYRAARILTCPAGVVERESSLSWFRHPEGAALLLAEQETLLIFVFRVIIITI